MLCYLSPQWQLIAATLGAEHGQSIHSRTDTDRIRILKSDIRASLVNATNVLQTTDVRCSPPGDWIWNSRNIRQHYLHIAQNWRIFSSPINYKLVYVSNPLQYSIVRVVTSTVKSDHKAVVLSAVSQLGIPNPDDFFQTRVSGLDALKPGFGFGFCNFEE